MPFRPANLVHTEEGPQVESTGSPRLDGSLEPGTRSSAGEHPLHTGRVAGSIPAASTIPDLPGEVWRPDVLTGAPGLMVSSLGRVKTRDRTVFRRGRSGEVVACRSIRGKILKPHRNQSGREVVGVNYQGRAKNHFVHRLVCAAFHGPPPFPEAQTCHNNGDSSDNRPENLRWDTAKGNAQDRYLHGTMLHGERSPHSKLTDDLVLMFRRRAADGLSFYDLPEAAPFGRAAIWRAVTGDTWRHLPHFGPDGAPVSTAGCHTRRSTGPRAGKIPCGSANPCSKLDEDKVRAIRASAEINRVLAERYGVALSLVHRVRNYKSWTHVT